MRWIDRLHAALRRGTFTKRDRALAGDWGTCAVGEAPRSLTGVKRELGTRLALNDPTDLVLEAAGHAFTQAVRGNRITDAFTHFAEIGQRTRELKLAKAGR